MHSHRAVPELPQLTTGVHLLEAEGRPVGPLHALVLDHLLLDGGRAVWVDANGYASSTHLAELAPSPRVLDRIDVARGFTAYQHQALLQDATDAIEDATSLLVAPAVDRFYRDDDIRGAEPQALLMKSLSQLASYAREAGLPVLVTRTAADDFAAPVERLADAVLTVQQTAFGPRFQGPDFETLCYTDGGATMQTTLTYWAQVLEARAPLHEEAATEEPTARVSP